MENMYSILHFFCTECLHIRYMCLFFYNLAGHRRAVMKCNVRHLFCIVRALECLQGGKVEDGSENMSAGLILTM